MDMTSDATQNAPKTPYTPKKVLCPVCETPAIHWYLNDSTYTIGSRDPDYFISKYTWKETEHNLYSLHTFGLWHCQVCRFTDDRRAFLQKDLLRERQQFLILKNTLIAKRKSSDHFFQRIAPHIKYPANDVLTALNLAILSIYTHTLPEPDYQDYDKIAMHCLRAAWLFKVASQKSDIKEIEHFLNGYNEKFERLQSNIMNTLAANEELNQAVTDQNKHEDGSLSWQQQWAQRYPVLTSSYKTTCSAIDDMLGALKTYYAVSNNFKAMLLNADKALLEMPYHDYQQYTHFLTELQELDPGIPTSESEAYQRAMEFFQKALTAKGHEKDSIKKFKVYELVIAIYERSGDDFAAMEFCKTLQKSAIQYYQHLKEKFLKQRTLSGTEASSDHLKGLLQHTQTILRNAKAIQTRISERIEKKPVRETLILNDLEDDVKFKVNVDELEIKESIFDEDAVQPPVDKKKNLFSRFKF